MKFEKTALDHAIDEFERMLDEMKQRQRSQWRKTDHPCSKCGKPVWHIGADCYQCMNCGLGFGGWGI